MNLHLRFVLPLTTLLLVLPGVARGQFKVEDRVVATGKVELRVPEGKTDTVQPGEEFTVEAVNGKWLWVRRFPKSKPGWIEAARVVPEDKSVDYFSEKIRKNPRDGEAFFGRGQRYFGNILNPQEDRAYWEKGITDYTEAIRLGYRTAEVYYQRAFVWMMIEEYDKALPDLSETIRLNANHDEAYGMRGVIYQGKGEYAKALADYAVALRLSPQDTSVHNGLAMIRAACPDAKYRDGKLALVHATKAYNLAEFKGAPEFEALAAAHAELGNFDKAVEYATKGAALFPDDDGGAFKELLELYKNKKPYREPLPEKE